MDKSSFFLKKLGRQFDMFNHQSISVLRRLNPAYLLSVLLRFVFPEFLLLTESLREGGRLLSISTFENPHHGVMIKKYGYFPAFC
jgi:hypothetical protein